MDESQPHGLEGSTTWAGTMDRLDTCIREAKVDDLRYSVCIILGRTNVLRI
jgi:hypothetical protein